jgi:glycosyltransferase involved in cell wall biosynthesis
MKILLVDQFSGAGGGQQCLLDLVPAFVARSWQVHAAVPSGGTLGERLTILGVKVREFPPLEYASGPKTPGDAIRFAADMPRLASIIRQEAADIVYANGPRILPAAALAAKTLVFHAHSLLNQRSARALAQISLRSRTAMVIAACRLVAAPLPRRNLQVIYSGVADHAGNGLPRRGGTPRIGLVGRISPEKGHLDFLRAARIVLEKNVKCEFVICGATLYSNDAYLVEVREMAKGLPVTFLGWREDVGAVLRDLDVLAVPSAPIEAAPRVILEAFSAGVPVVAYPSGGIVELIEHGRNGMLTGGAQPELLAASLVEVLADPIQRECLGAGGRASYLERFTLERYRREVLAVLDGI